MKQNIPNDARGHYDLMRKLNPDLPDWDSADPKLKELHESTYKDFLLPILTEIDAVVKKGKTAR